MAYAKFSAQLDQKQRDQYLMLPKKSGLLLANADPEVVEFLLDDEHIDQTRRLRTKTELSELARSLTETEDALERHRKENEQLHAELKALKEKEEIKVAGSEYPLEVTTFRKEAAVRVDEANASLNAIRAKAEEFMRLDMDKGEGGFVNTEAAITPAIANVANLIAQAQNLLRDLSDDFNIELKDVYSNAHKHPFSEVEQQEIRIACEMMGIKQNARAMNRNQAAIDSGEARRGRGRPRKSS